MEHDDYRGCAFGVGIARAAKLKDCINNINLMFESYLRVLEQINDA